MYSEAALEAGVNLSAKLCERAAAGRPVTLGLIGAGKFGTTFLAQGVSVASAALRREPTGAPTGFRSDVVATAQRNLKAGEMLDGEGGFCVWGRQTPAERSLAEGLLPLGLAHNVALIRDVSEGAALKWSDVAYDAGDPAVRTRREMEAAFASEAAAAAR